MKGEGDWAKMAASCRRTVRRIRERQEKLRKRQQEEEVPNEEQKELERRIWMLEQEEREMVEKVADIEEYLR